VVETIRQCDLVLGIGAEGRLGNRLGSCQLVSATYRNRAHLACTQDTPKIAAGIRASIPDDDACTVSSIHYQLGGGCGAPAGGLGRRMRAGAAIYSQPSSQQFRYPDKVKVFVTE
jgi:hypothetical protein